MVYFKSIGVFFIAILTFLSYEGDKNTLEKMMHKEISKVFDSDDFQKISFDIPVEINRDLPARITTENFYKITRKDVSLGYVYLDKAPSKTADFDYLVIFNVKMEIIHTKVLIYREEYGGEIGSKRWLRQFMGLGGDDRVNYKTNIDGIAGATISVRSMTMSIDNLLQTIGILQKKQLI